MTSGIEQCLCRILDGIQEEVRFGEAEVGKILRHEVGAVRRYEDSRFGPLFYRPRQQSDSLLCLPVSKSGDPVAVELVPFLGCRHRGQQSLERQKQGDDPGAVDPPDQDHTVSLYGLLPTERHARARYTLQKADCSETF